LSQGRISELRAKARRARELADLSSDPRALANLRSYACDLDGEADKLEAQLKPVRPETEVPGIAREISPASLKSNDAES
jgi:hypothetical protein